MADFMLEAAEELGFPAEQLGFLTEQFEFPAEQLGFLNENQDDQGNEGDQEDQHDQRDQGDQGNQHDQDDQRDQFDQEWQEESQLAAKQVHRRGKDESLYLMLAHVPLISLIVQNPSCTPRIYLASPAFKWNLGAMTQKVHRIRYASLNLNQT
jgi:hypothetical protein